MNEEGKKGSVNRGIFLVDIIGLLDRACACKVSFFGRLTQPLDALAVSPLALASATISVSVGAQSVLTSVLPQSLVHASVRPSEPAVPLLLIIDVVSLIPAAVFPGEHTIAVHLILKPLPDVAAVVGPVVRAASLNLILDELSIVVRLVIPLEEASAMLVATLKDSFVESSIDPGLLSLARLLVI